MPLSVPADAALLPRLRIEPHFTSISVEKERKHSRRILRRPGAVGTSSLLRTELDPQITAPDFAVPLTCLQHPKIGETG